MKRKLNGYKSASCPAYRIRQQEKRGSKTGKEKKQQKEQNKNRQEKGGSPLRPKTHCYYFATSQSLKATICP